MEVDQTGGGGGGSGGGGGIIMVPPQQISHLKDQDEDEPMNSGDGNSSRTTKRSQNVGFVKKRSSTRIAPAPQKIKKKETKKKRGPGRPRKSESRKVGRKSQKKRKRGPGRPRKRWAVKFKNFNFFAKVGIRNYGKFEF